MFNRLKNIMQINDLWELAKTYANNFIQINILDQGNLVI
jgi:hypothetical protein